MILWWFGGSDYKYHVWQYLAECKPAKPAELIDWLKKAESTEEISSHAKYFFRKRVRKMEVHACVPTSYYLGQVQIAIYHVARESG